ncbi:helix-turn-helix domain-containing protein [Phaeobacter sp. C3_T13_0]|uniref:helix-turn-helix domain-containing protein n=1 Tax=Phaeobacter cretensis TaxID=3342641 RepID=UPI0039BC506C
MGVFARISDSHGAGETIGKFDLVELLLNGLPEREIVDVAQYEEGFDDLSEGLEVHCLALGGVDLTSSAGKMTMNVINAVAQFERDLLIERTQSGLARAKAEGKPLGRPSALSEDQQAEVKQKLENGETISAIARQFETSRQTIIRVRARP